MNIDCGHYKRKVWELPYFLRGYLVYQEYKERWDLKGKDNLDLR